MHLIHSLPAGLHHRHADGRADGRRAARRGQLRRRRPGHSRSRRRTTTRSRPTAAAEAGLSYYLNRLAQDNSYYTHCANVPSPSQNAVNLEWNGTGADPRLCRKHPGHQSDYTVELLASRRRRGHRAVRARTRPDSMIDPRRAPSGSARPAARAPPRRDRQAEEAQHRGDAAAQGLPRLPLLHRPRDARPAGVQRSATDRDLGGRATASTAAGAAGRLHRDQLHHAGQRERPVAHERQHPGLRLAQLRQRRRTTRSSSTRTARAGSSGGSSGDPGLHRHARLPRRACCRCRSRTPSSRPSADAGYVFSRRDDDRVQRQLDERDRTTAPRCPSMPLPPSGVVYVKSTSCSRRLRHASRPTPAARGPGCGNVRVSGTYNKDLTIGADNDIIVMDDFKSSQHAATVLGGLIANNFVRVYHPVNGHTAPTATTTAARAASRSTPRSSRSTTRSS